VVHFVNPDLIASGLSPLRPELAALAAGRLFLRELDRFAKFKNDFAFESTLSGLTYLNRIEAVESRGLLHRDYISAGLVTRCRASTYRRAG
jgi:predicted ABC-type ATPase